MTELQDIINNCVGTPDRIPSCLINWAIGPGGIIIIAGVILIVAAFLIKKTDLLNRLNIGGGA